MGNIFEHDYTFDSFITTPHNEMAFNAAQMIAREPGTRYNPFFLYGDTVSGKTHLLHAIGNAASKEKSYLGTIYVSGKQLYSDISYAIKKHKLTLFYLNYQKCGLLMIDDFDIFANKDIEQNAAIRLFDAMWKSKKQVIVTSRLPSRHFPVIEEYFRSYDTGLICDVTAPEGLMANKALLSLLE